MPVDACMSQLQAPNAVDIGDQPCIRSSANFQQWSLSIPMNYIPDWLISLYGCLTYFTLTFMRMTPAGGQVGFLDVSDCGRPYGTIRSEVCTPQNSVVVPMAYSGNHLKTSANHVRFDIDNPPIQLTTRMKFPVPTGWRQQAHFRLFFHRSAKNIIRSL